MQVQKIFDLGLTKEIAYANLWVVRDERTKSPLLTPPCFLPHTCSGLHPPATRIPEWTGIPFGKQPTAAITRAAVGLLLFGGRGNWDVDGGAWA